MASRRGVSRLRARHHGLPRGAGQVSSAREVGDEPALIHRLTGAPVFVLHAAPRLRAHMLLARHPGTQVIVSDDGLQHLALARDIEICVFDDRGIGNGWLLPAGPLREHWPRPCDLVLHTGDRPVFAGFTARRALADHAVRSDGHAAAAGRAAESPPSWRSPASPNPNAFFAMLRARGIAPTRLHRAARSLSILIAGSAPSHGPYEPRLHRERRRQAMGIVAPSDALGRAARLHARARRSLQALDAKLAKLSSTDGHQAA